MPDVISRAEAKARRMPAYFTGKACRNGHVDFRRTGSGTCATCARTTYLVWRAKNTDSARAATKEWQSKNTIAVRAYSADYYQKTRESQAAKSAAYALQNAEALRAKRVARHAANRERFNNESRNWRRANPERKRFLKAMGHRRLRRAKPAWLTKDQIEEMAAIYAAARLLSEQTGTLHHVDHYYPLVSDVVCGLHVPWNLQILTASENGSKKNSFPGHDPQPLRRAA